MTEETRDRMLNWGKGGLVTGMLAGAGVAVTEFGWTQGIGLMAAISLACGLLIALAATLAPGPRGLEAVELRALLAAREGEQPRGEALTDPAFLRARADRLEREMWTEPQRESGSMHAIIDYAGTVPAPVYAGVILGVGDWDTMIHELRRRWFGLEREWMGFVELRMLLFAKAWQFVEWQVESEVEVPERQLEELRSLYAAVYEAWHREESGEPQGSGPGASGSNDGPREMRRSA